MEKFNFSLSVLFTTLLLIFLTVTSCKKEDSSLVNLETVKVIEDSNGLATIELRSKENGSPVVESLSELGSMNGSCDETTENYNEMPQYPFYDGTTRLIFKWCEDGACGCQKTKLTINLYSLVNGGLLYTTSVDVFPGTWNEVLLPSEGRIFFQNECIQGNVQPGCIGTMWFAPFGYNFGGQGTISQWNGQLEFVYNWLQVPPYNLNTPLAGRYITRPYCNLLVPYSLNPNSSGTANCELPYLHLRYATNGFTVDHLFLENGYNTGYLYPISPQAGHTYILESDSPQNSCDGPDTKLCYNVCWDNPSQQISSCPLSNQSWTSTPVFTTSSGSSGGGHGGSTTSTGCVNYTTNSPSGQCQ